MKNALISDLLCVCLFMPFCKLQFLEILIRVLFICEIVKSPVKQWLYIQFKRVEMRNMFIAPQNLKNTE